MEKIFKAKHLDTGEWVEFDFNQCKGADTSNGYRVNLTDNLYYSNIVRVNPKTICQYTGINDSEGNRIFEGDYVQWGCDVEPVVEYVLYHAKEAAFLTETSCMEEGLFLLTGHNIHDRG